MSALTDEPPTVEKKTPIVDDVRILAELLDSEGIISYGDFTLASGRKSNYYIDMKKAITDIETLRLISKRMSRYVEDADKVAGVELGAVPLAVAVALELDKDHIMVRKEKKGHGTRKAFEGEIREGEKVVFVEDVTTTGGSLKEGISAVREAGGIVEKAIVVVDREEGAAENLAGIGVSLIPLLRASDLKSRGEPPR